MPPLLVWVPLQWVVALPLQVLAWAAPAGAVCASNSLGSAVAAPVVGAVDRGIDPLEGGIDPLNGGVDPPGSSCTCALIGRVCNVHSLGVQKVVNCTL